jgi:hypothetical protein
VNDLITIYQLFKQFGDNHGMVNEFKLIGSLEDLQDMEVNHRGMYVNLDSANISRVSNSPVYDIMFNIIIIDKVPLNDELALMSSNQENLFVMNQLQDFFGGNLLGEERFDEINLQGFSADDYNITTATANCSFSVGRNPDNRGIDI